MRTLIATLVVLLLSLPARSATSFAPDISGLWWNPAESGWGVNLIQQGSTIFATFFVYGADGRPSWFTASDMRGPSTPGQPMVFSGKLYESTGPAFSSAFDPNAVVRREVGNATFEYLSLNEGTLTYSVHGVQMTKQIRRQTWALNDITGHFIVNRVLRGQNCDPATPVIEQLGVMEVVRGPDDSAHILNRPIAPYASLSCGYSGTYSQDGRMGTIMGGHTCADMTYGDFVLSEIEVSAQGFSAKLTQTVNGCTRSGTFGGPRATVP